MADQVTLHIAKDFSRTPGARLRKEGAHSAEQFRDELLIPRVREAMNSDSKLLIDLDGTAGYAACFLEEAFGGLVRKHPDWRPIRFMKFKSVEQPELVEEITGYMFDVHAEIGISFTRGLADGAEQLGLIQTLQSKENHGE